MKYSHWLLLNSDYVLDNENAKWQADSDSLFANLGLSQSLYVPQLFYAFKNNFVDTMAAKIVVDVLITAKRDKIDKFICSVKSQYKLGTIAHRPGSFLFNGLYVVQDTNFMILIYSASKLESLSCFPTDRCRRKQISETLNLFELKSYGSVNSSIGWFGTNASLLCIFYSSWLQQRAPHQTVEYLIYQINVLKFLKNHETSISYNRQEKENYDLHVLIFADANQRNDHGQLYI